MILLACYTLILMSMMIVVALTNTTGMKRSEVIFAVVVLFPVSIFAGLYLVDVLFLT
ncbi:hypothetical protein vBBak6_001 [Bacillus phage v_B-Bak6]|nr:hypothetical protein vBBak1_001 [Bacillus phage v_B-Bak1]AXY83083.1 hypothetical protein vBBak6_001 [Bacillus phage v_B-Bak6]